MRTIDSMKQLWLEVIHLCRRHRGGGSLEKYTKTLGGCGCLKRAWWVKTTCLDIHRQKNYTCMYISKAKTKTKKS